MAPRPEDPDAPADWPLLEFLARFREDEARGERRALSHYLAGFPEHEEAVAAEFLQVRALDAEAERSSAEEVANARQIGRFRLVRELGRGGEGRVHLAYDARLRRHLALKLHDAPGCSELEEARLLRAATMLARLDHPHLCRVLDAGREGPALWTAMQFVEGRTLAEELDARRIGGRPFPVRAAARLLVGPVDGLRHAHEHGVVHRDLKPGNLILRAGSDPDHAASWTDFGLARDTDARHDLTLAGHSRGTPAYMAPELLEGAPADARSDLWAVGVVLFECLTLAHPFSGTSLAAVARAIAERPVWSHPAWRTLSPDARAVLATALAIDPQERYASAAALRDDLGRLARSQPVSARRPGPITRLAAWTRRETGLAVGIGVAVLALFLGTGLALVAWNGERAARAQAEERAARTLGIAESILFDMDDALAEGEGGVAMRHRLVVRARDALAELHATDPEDRRITWELALAWMRAGDVAGDPGAANRADLEEARHCHAMAEALALGPLAEDPRQPRLCASLLVKRAGLANDDPASARALCLQALEIPHDDDPETARLLAIANTQLAQLDRDAGLLESARQRITTAERALLGLRTATPFPTSPLDLAVARDVRATIEAASGHVESAIDLLRETDAGLDSDRPTAPARTSRVRASLRMHLGQCLLLAGDDHGALEALSGVVDLWRARIASDPGDGGAARRLGAILEERGRAHATLGNAQAAQRDWTDAIRLAESWGFETTAKRLHDRLLRGPR